MKQTAVEWLVKEITTKHYKSFIDFYGAEIEQAKKIEKQQIIDAYWDGGQDIPLTENRCNQYYNQTFKKK